MVGYVDFDAHFKVMLDPFARPITVHPRASQPHVGSYSLQADGVSPLRGSWRSAPVDVPLADGSILSSQDHTLSIRESEFAVPPVQGDQIEIDAYQASPRLGLFAVEDSDSDGQGWAVLLLKVIGE